jgi:transposase
MSVFVSSVPPLLLYQYRVNLICGQALIPQIKSRAEEKTEKTHNPSYLARRWVVEVSYFWMNRFRKLLVRYEKLTCSYKGLLMLACSFIAFRKADVI